MTTNSKNVVIIIVFIVLAIILYGVLTAPDRRTTGEKIGDAASELSDGVGDAARQLEDRTPGEKLGDAVEDMGESIQENTGN